MAYLGEKPSQTLASPTSQYFNGDGSTVAFTLNRAVNVAEDLDVFVNNVVEMVLFLLCRRNYKVLDLKHNEAFLFGFRL